MAQEIDTESHEKAENFSFIKCQISVGEEIEYYDDPSIKCKVVGDRKVEYKGKEMSLTAAAKLNIRLQDQGSLNIKASG